MENKILKVIANWHIESPEDSGLELLKTLPEDSVEGSWWYFHGKLCNIVGYDKGVIINFLEKGFSKNQPDWLCIGGNKIEELRSSIPIPRMYYTGIIPVEVLGINEPCIGFFWVTNEREVTYKGKSAGSVWMQRGLVCLCSDTEAIAYAADEFTSREESL